MVQIKRFLAIVLAVLIGSAFSVYADGAPCTEVDDDVFNLILDEYFDKRENDFNASKQLMAQGVNCQSQLEAIPNSEMRPYLILKMEEKLNLTVVSAQTSYSVREIKVEDDIIHLDVYEWTYVDYTGEIGLIDTFGYGVNHEIVLEKDGIDFKLISDTYDEGPLTEMSSSLSQGDFIQLMGTEYPICNVNSITTSENDFSSERSVSGYDPCKAVEYANKWVYQGAQGGEYYDYYNTSQYATNRGADCTNYVSQCMYAGGIKMDSISNSSGWWYDKTKLWSNVWFTADPHFRYFSNQNVAYSNISVNSGNSSIIPGNPVYHDKNGDGNINHATICVGYDVNGVPIVNSHTDDYYHIRWFYGSPTTKYGVVELTKDDILNTTSGAATLKLNEAYYAKLDNSSDIDCFKFIPTQTKQYTFTTTGNTNTYGKLCSSSGTVLNSNEDSGVSNNFSITQTLTKGQTYYIYVSSSYPVQGFYGLKVS
ncbi:MAG: amidase domain-containing protein [Firmicutes bacterium]|nr:amidase domain-containing protein [[Eubacterium] siraeum]MCM1487045.1 amidase domain-containing protein [Bacillota bacterium]